MEKWKVTDRREVYADPPWLRIHSETVHLPDGKVVEGFHQVQLLDYSLMMAERADGRFIVIRQYKHGIGDVSLMPPAGGMNPGEDPLETAKRELMEETGHEATGWTKLIEMVSHSNQRCAVGHLYYARDARQVAAPDSGDLEEQELLYLTRDEIKTAIRGGQVKSASALAAFSLVIGGILP
jgi:ADP-ribose pyrophosphatase